MGHLGKFGIVLVAALVVLLLWPYLSKFSGSKGVL